MAGPFVYDRVRETSTTTGTGNFTLAGAVTGYRAFSAVAGTDSFYYCIAHRTADEWEVGSGSLSGGALARTTVHASSNAGAAVNFSAGTKDVFLTAAAHFFMSRTGCSVLGRFSNSAGPLADIVATTDGQVLKRQGGAVFFADIQMTDLETFDNLTDAEPALDDTLPGYDHSADANREFAAASVLGLARLSPGGRLTLTAGTPATTADVSAASKLYYSPHAHDLIPVWDGTRWRIMQFGEFGLTLASLTDAKNYDVFAFGSSDVPVSTDTGTDVLTFGGSGPGWSTGSSVRVSVTGGGLTAGTNYWYNALSGTTGALYATLADALANTNKVNLTASITATLTAVGLEVLVWTNDTTRATAVTYQDGRLCLSGGKTRLYLGTFRTTSTSTTEDSVAKRFLWNMYNRRQRVLYKAETTNSWTVSSQAWESLNGSTANRVEFVRGVSEDAVSLFACCNLSFASANNAFIGFGLDSTTANSAKISNGGGGTSIVPANAMYEDTPSAGYHYLQVIQAIQNAAPSATFYGDAGLEPGMRTGCNGHVWG
jgi:hypothetical protein